MQLTNILALAVLALGITAHPSVEGRTSKPNCKGGQVYNSHHHQCVCPPKQSWDDGKNKCSYPPLSTPSCPKDENPWCSKSEKEYCKYDKKHDWCQNDGYGSVWCSKDKDAPQKCKDKYNPPSKPVCKDKQKYNPDHNKCECPHPMYWKHEDQKCHYQPKPKPNCPRDQKPWCGKSKSKYCEWDDKHDYCEDDGTSYTWCAKDKDVNGGGLLEKLFDLL